MALKAGLDRGAMPSKSRRERSVLAVASPSGINARKSHGSILAPVPARSAPGGRDDCGQRLNSLVAGLGGSENGPSSLGKRNRDDKPSVGPLWQAFTIKAHPPVIFGKPRRLSPLFVLPRMRLPLASLDTENLSGALPRSRFFTAHIECLESANDESLGKISPVVLIARFEADRSLFAVERVKQDRYALCKLGNWVKAEDLQPAAVWKPDAPAKSEEKQVHARGEKAERAEAALQAPAGSTGIKRRRLEDDHAARVPAALSETGGVRHGAIRDSSSNVIHAFESPAPDSTEALRGQIAEDSPPNQRQQTQHSLTIDDRDPSPLDAAPEPVDLAPVESDPRDVFRVIQTQYLETLYLSKASLAYFAKGPLSRARVSLGPVANSQTTDSGMTGYLQTCILEPTRMDKKYRECLPELVQSLLPVDISDDEPDPTATDNAKATRKRKRRHNKLGPGKDGMFSHEDEYVARWWRVEDDDQTMAAARESGGDVTKRKLAALRMRETKLQVILILEVLALQSLSGGCSGKGEADDRRKGKDGDERKKATKGGGRKRKVDLDLMLELLLDRLCIWQSVNPDDHGAMSQPMDFASNVDGKTGEAANGRSTRPTDPDDLRDFCVEVLVPFYGSRLPDRCKTVNQRLGGPVAASSARPPPPNRARVSKSGRPGAPTRRTAPEKPQRRLERVLTDDRIQNASRRRPIPPSLTRSATAPAVPQFRREPTETSVSAMAPNDSQTLSVSRGGILDAKRFSQREVDLGRAASRVEAKKRTQAALEDELKGAIQALKKPNRGLAARDYTEDRERRVTTSASNAKARKPVGLASVRSVQVHSTPKARRTRDVNIMVTPTATRVDQNREARLAPPSIDVCIPSSAVRPGPLRVVDDVGETPVKTAQSLDIQETPCRRPSKLGLTGRWNSQPCIHLDFDPVLRSSPSAPRTTTIMTLPATSSGPVFSSGFLSGGGDSGTPAKTKPTSTGASTRPASAATTGASRTGLVVAPDHGRSAQNSPGDEPSIYTLLGWDEVDELA